MCWIPVFSAYSPPYAEPLIAGQTGSHTVSHSGRASFFKINMAKKTRDRRKGKTTRKNRSSRSASAPQHAAAMVFQRGNYLLLLLGIAMIVIGYVMMRTENEVDGFISLYVAPLIILGGYLEIIYAILWKPKKKEDELQTAGESE